MKPHPTTTDGRMNQSQQVAQSQRDIPRTRQETESQQKRTRPVCSFVSLLGFVVASAISPTIVTAEDHYEGYYRYLTGKDYPRDGNFKWTNEINGVAHDPDHWFFASMNDDPVIYKFLVTSALLGDYPAGYQPGDSVYIHDSTDVWNTGCHHVGDIDCREYRGKYYLFVALGYSPGVIAVFDPDTFSYMSYATLQQNDCGWVAVDDTYVYSSNYRDDSSPTAPHVVCEVLRYAIDWETLRTSNQLVLTNVCPLSLFDESGNPFCLDDKHGIQGGVVSPSGDLLYIGISQYDGFYLKDGIHVFDLKTGRRLQHSCNGTTCLFSCEFSPGWPTGDETEGLDFWDLDDGRAPGVTGQLHLIINNNQSAGDDHLTFKHYTSNVYVDSARSSGDGTVSNAYPTVQEAATIVSGNAWNGSQIKIKGGSYPGSVTFLNRMQVLSWDGNTVTIGQ